MKLEGIVIKGRGRGRQLGFPTANIAPEQPFFKEGIFIATIIIDTKKYSALFFSGPPKTFNDYYWSHEAYILDFDKDLYGKKVEVEIIKKIRDNKKFENVEKLKEAIYQDIQVAKKYFQGHHPERSERKQTKPKYL